MTPVPYAAKHDERFFLDWLQAFAAYVRDVDYQSARPLFHPDVIAFGTHRDVISSLEQWVADQWDNVWPKTSDFEFDLGQTKILIADDASMASVIAPWTSTGYHQDNRPFDRPGRATMIFHRQADNWVCVHSHMSLNRGVPQQSFANRPVKAE
jgi:ketosteroid isomerase-like protein